MIPFELFYHLVRTSQFSPQTIFVWFRQLKNIYIGHSSKKDNHPFHSKAFVLLYKFETSWALLGRLSSAFFGAISGASNFKHFKELFMTLSGLGLLTMWEFPCVDVSFFVSSLLKTILSALLKDFWSSPSFLAFKTFISPWSFTTQHSDFSSFLAVSITDKQVNRSIHAYALT